MSEDKFKEINELNKNNQVKEDAFEKKADDFKGDNPNLFWKTVNKEYLDPKFNKYFPIENPITEYYDGIGPSDFPKNSTKKPNLVFD